MLAVDAVGQLGLGLLEEGVATEEGESEVSEVFTAGAAGALVGGFGEVGVVVKGEEFDDVDGGVIGVSLD